MQIHIERTPEFNQWFEGLNLKDQLQIDLEFNEFEIIRILVMRKISVMGLRNYDGKMADEFIFPKQGRLLFYF